MSLHDLPDCNLRTGLSLGDLAQRGDCGVEDWIGLSVCDLAQQGKGDDEDCISLFLGNLGQGTVMMVIASACSLVIWVSKETVMMRTEMA